MLEFEIFEEAKNVSNASLSVSVKKLVAEKLVLVSTPSGVKELVYFNIHNDTENLTCLAEQASLPSS